MSNPQDERPTESENEHVTYVVVVHGIGEQRKNECVINVVNRFAEARRNAEADDNRDVLTLGKASSQTGWSKTPVTGQPWIEFDGIPASRNAPTPTKPFLGEPPKDPGQNLRFVDLCWSDVMQDSVEHVGQDVDLWAKGLVGRLLRKHEAAESAAKEAETKGKAQAAEAAQVPLWIRRILHLLADTLLLVRFAMNFRFKEMKELVFVKFLGDVQLYGEYDRCRGQAVRRFHELMAKVEATHYAEEPDLCNPRSPRYVIIAHSLGSIMSLDALLYARATSAVRLGRRRCQWEFPGYLRDSNRLAPPDTGWSRRVESFVTLGSPIDKYLTIWWLNYRYLLKCKDDLRKAPKIAHFNYCDELDPVGHSLDVVRDTPVYEAVFKRGEDVVFNRYAIPGAAHNKYWTDQRLFRWILYRAVDGDTGNGGRPPKQPRWFRRRVYWMLLFWLYVFVPLLVAIGTYVSLSLALQSDGWRSAGLAAVVSSLLVYFGRRLIDLSIWWRQIQRLKSTTFWADHPPKDAYTSSRRRAGTAFRTLVTALPVVLAAQTTTMFQTFTNAGDSMPNRLALSDMWVRDDLLARLLLVLGLLALVATAFFAWFRILGLPKAYRTPVKVRQEAGAILVAAGCVAAGVGMALHPVSFPLPLPVPIPASWIGTLASFSAVATLVSAYSLYRLLVVKTLLRASRHLTIRFTDYVP